MICRLCLKDIIDVINIFDDMGVQLNVAGVLSKYFWFEPRSDDPISTAICKACWTNVSTFNEFYLGVEEAHRLLTERFSLKTADREVKCHKRRRCSPINNEREVEEWLHTNFSITKNVLDLENEKKTKIDCGGEKVSKDKLNKAEEAKPSKCEVGFDDYEQLSVNSESFMEEVLGLVEDSEDALAVPIENECRTTRSRIKKSEENTSPMVKSSTECSVGAKLNAPAEELPKKRRGRPPKIKNESINNQTPKKGKQKKSYDSEQESYEERMRQIDEKIAQCLRLTCDVCAVEQPTFSNLRKHMEQVHQCKGYAICCNKKFHKRSLLVGHIEKHINPNAYRCESCDKTFAGRQCMRNHFLIKHQPEEEKQFQCEHCSKRFARPYILDQHRLTHEERKFHCEVCKKGFPTETLLNTHLKVMHSSYGATMCDICAKVIRGRAAFARHQLEHTGVVLPKVQCDKCGSWHKDKYSLQKHKRRHNDDGTVHVCAICGKVAPNRSALLSHQRYVHKSERVFECGVCKKAFKKAITLKEHMAMHTGEVLYNCPHCPKTFNSNANMHSHRKKMHPKEFEERRKQRRENAAKTDQATDQIEENVEMNLVVQNQTKVEIVNTSDDDEDSKERIVVIKSYDDNETHNILLTTEGFSDNEVEGDMHENSIVFTIN
ncbi:transcription factor grauzone isoform X2 [Eurosta solidaginis]|uniref:transcription factor grauzone isoform X2 n=1 Tax=Eurosta solidaginis TaxID=178769 RepID=UPI0035312117